MVKAGNHLKDFGHKNTKRKRNSQKQTDKPITKTSLAKHLEGYNNRNKTGIWKTTANKRAWENKAMKRTPTCEKKAAKTKIHAQ
jgi:hypothetical protein